jgi:SAM-dependent methyltransferase
MHAMKPEAFNRLQALRMENTAAGYRQEELRTRFNWIAGRHENGTAPRAVVAYQLFQTPKPIADRLAALLDLKPGERVLEPSAGLGRLLDAIAPYNPGEVVAVEQAANCARELFNQNRAGVTLKQCDFLTLTPDDLGTFDAIIMNPPFHLRSDICHIEHAYRFMNPGGRIAALCMGTESRRLRFQDIADHWEELPEGTFKSEGTNVSTYMFRMRE